MSDPQEVAKDVIKPEESIEDILETIKKNCLESRSFVIYYSYMTGLRDRDGNKMITSKYQRYHFPFEDAVNSIKHFKKEIQEDILRRM